jgi:hypothetical protein
MKIIMKIEEFPSYYKTYKWERKHHLFGYPPDTYPNFSWIKSLETRFDWLRRNFLTLKNEEQENGIEKSVKKKTVSIYLIKEMIEWGGSQNGVLQKFNDRSGEINLFKLITSVVDKIENPKKAIESAIAIPGLGLTYASKLLRFLKPDLYGALDTRIGGALNKEGNLEYNTNSQIKRVESYCQFLTYLGEKKKELKQNEIKKPECSLSKKQSWRISDIEMALFRWAELNTKKTRTSD